MNTIDPICRWPPIYDSKSLGEEINKLIKNKEIFRFFFHRSGLEPGFCQGDVFKYPGLFPFINKNGDVDIVEEDYDYWMVLGNTCDFHNPYPGTKHCSHITPLIPLEKDTPSSVIDDLHTYKYYRKFFVPPWDSSVAPGFIINFTFMCSVEVQSLNNHTELAARLRFKPWLLLHSCLVRYLARDDGRND